MMSWIGFSPVTCVVSGSPVISPVAYFRPNGTTARVPTRAALSSPGGMR